MMGQNIQAIVVPQAESTSSMEGEQK